MHGETVKIVLYLYLLTGAHLCVTCNL